MLRKKQFGRMPDGREVSRFVLSNTNGVEVAITDYAAALTSFKAPDRQGRFADIVLGFDSLDGYLRDKVFMGAVVGRYANRIANARFSLEGNEYRLIANNRQNTLHGGADGFFKKLWELKANGDNSVTLFYSSPDGEEGFPGELVAEVTYTLTDANELKLEYRATTDRPTVVNLTGHAYFNLAGEGESSILDNELMIDADLFVPTDAVSIPTGEIRPVKGTPFDFTSFARIGDRIAGDDEQIKFGNGYDRCWVLRKQQIGDLRRAASVREPNNGCALEIWTTEPGIQFYSGNFLDATITGKSGRIYPQHSGLCLETQHFPDSPNRAHFPSTVLKPGQEYRSTTIYKLSTT
jgi:aldose 1-epimerase